MRFGTVSAVAVLLLAALPAAAQQQGPGAAVTSVPTGAPGQGLPELQSAATEASHIFKATPGNLYSLGVINTGTAGFVMLVDGTTVPGDGALASCGSANATGCLKACYPIGTGTTSTPVYGGFDLTPGPPIPFVNGIVALYSTTGCTTKTLGSTNIFFEARVY